MGWDWLVTVVLALHFAYVAYVPLGGFLAWRWPAAFWPHLVASSWGLLIALHKVDCPLTWAEDRARRLAGQGPLTAGFVDRFLQGTIYHDERSVVLLQCAVGTMVLVSWLGTYGWWQRRRTQTRTARAHRDNSGADTPAGRGESGEGTTTV